MSDNENTSPGRPESRRVQLLRDSTHDLTQRVETLERAVRALRVIILLLCFSSGVLVCCELIHHWRAR